MIDAPARTRVIDELLAASREGRQLAPLTERWPHLDADEAYAIAEEVIARRVADGERVVGVKLGLTSRAKQVEMDVHEPIGGWLTDAMRIPADGELEVALLGQPRVEPEIGFRLARPLVGDRVGVAEVMAATAEVMPAIDVLDSRFAGYRFRLPDVIADDASAGRFVLGPGVPVPDADLAEIGVVFELGGRLIGTAAGAAVLGHPAAAVAWWVRRWAHLGRGLEAGAIVLSGALMGASPVKPGDVVTATIDRLGSVTLRCR